MSPSPATTFDALTAARELEDAGLERRQAEAIAGTMRKATLADRDTLATKADIAELQAATKADIKAVRSDVGMLRWMLGLVAAAQLATVAKLFGIV